MVNVCSRCRTVKAMTRLNSIAMTARMQVNCSKQSTTAVPAPHVAVNLQYICFTAKHGQCKVPCPHRASSVTAVNPHVTNLNSASSSCDKDMKHTEDSDSPSTLKNESVSTALPLANKSSLLEGYCCYTTNSLFHTCNKNNKYENVYYVPVTPFQ